jgi:hypothetical protein
MHKLALTTLTLVLLASGASTTQAAKLQPGYYAYSLLVFGNASQRYATGCLRWHWQNMSWYDHCQTAQQRALVVRY